jgi:general stress protein 13
MENEYKVNDIIPCIVTGIEKYGIFVNVNNWYDGLIHISEVSSLYVKNIKDYVHIGEEIYCRILEINSEEHQMKLSIKDINYKSDDSDSPVKETRKGFLPLKENLDGWIEEKKKVYSNWDKE